MNSGWSHNDVFPAVARAIEAINAQQFTYAEHDAIVAHLLNDSEARTYIDAARSAERIDRSSEWIAHNMVAWFSQRITVGDSPWAARFERQKINGKWAYRVAN